MKTRAEMEAKFGKFSDEKWEAFLERCREIEKYLEAKESDKDESCC